MITQQGIDAIERLRQTRLAAWDAEHAAIMRPAPHEFEGLSGFLEANEDEEDEFSDEGGGI